MQPDVLDAFIGNKEQKIKVFPTRKDVKPFHVDSKLIRKAFPFLLVSAMVFTSCSERKNNVPENDTSSHTEEVSSKKYDTPDYWKNIYRRVVNQYDLINLKSKEPLDYEDIQRLMTAKHHIELTDTNFNHAPENIENFWEIIKGGLSVAIEMQSSPYLTQEQKQKYLDKSIEALSKISRIKGTKDVVDLSDYNNLHAFLFFEKVIRLQNRADAIFFEQKGWTDEQNEVFGRYYKDYQNFEKIAQSYHGIEIFAKALYANNDRLIISAEDSVFANALSNKMYEQWRREQNINDEYLYKFIDVHKALSPNQIVFGHSRGYQVGIILELDPTGKTELGTYSPVGLNKIHEVQHIQAMKSASNETPQDNHIASEKVQPDNIQRINDNLVELGPTLYTLTMSDRIYKAIHKIDRNQEVTYGVNLQLGDLSIDIGKVAQWFGEMLEKYPSPCVDRVLQQKEVLQTLNSWGLGKDASKLAMAAQNMAAR